MEKSDIPKLKHPKLKRQHSHDSDGSTASNSSSARSVSQSATPSSPRKNYTSKVVRLNVGGSIFTTSKDTLLKSNERTFFHGLFDKRHGAAVLDESDAYFIDRDGEVFAPILSFLRTGDLFLPPQMPAERVYMEAEFYNITLPPFQAQNYRTKIVTVQYHSFDNIGTFRNKVELEISKQETAGWKFIHSHVIEGASLDQYGLINQASDEPQTYLLYFQKSYLHTNMSVSRSGRVHCAPSVDTSSPMPILNSPSSQMRDPSPNTPSTTPPPPTTQTIIKNSGNNASGK